MKIATKIFNPNDQRGFTLIEVLVAIVVLAIGLLGAGAMQLSVINNNASAFDKTEATALAMDQMENVITWDYDDSRLTDDNDTPYQRIGDQLVGGGLMIMPVNSVADSLNSIGSFTVYLDISDDSPAVDSKTIRVDVVWTAEGILKTVSLNYVKTRY